MSIWLLITFLKPLRTYWGNQAAAVKQGTLTSLPPDLYYDRVIWTSFICNTFLLSAYVVEMALVWANIKMVVMESPPIYIQLYLMHRDMSNWRLGHVFIRKNLRTIHQCQRQEVDTIDQMSFSTCTSFRKINYYNIYSQLPKLYPQK